MWEMRPLPSVQRLLSARAAEKVAQSTSTSGVCGEKSSWRARGAAREAKSKNHRHGGEDRGVREEMKDSKCVEKDSCTRTLRAP